MAVLSAFRPAAKGAPPAMDPAVWNETLASLPGAHFLQTWQWGQVKVPVGWQPSPMLWHDKEGQPAAAALVLYRSIPMGGFAARLRIGYVPRGPVLRDWEDAGLRRQVFGDLRAAARRQGAIFIKVDPELPLGTGVPGAADAVETATGQQVQTELAAWGWQYARDQVQFRNTVMLDLTPSPEQLLQNMKQKTRYNIRLAEKRGVLVRPAGPPDFELLYRMYAETARRDGFVIRAQDYYQRVWTTFHAAGMADPLIAEVEGQAVAAVFVVRFAQKAWYFHGMSTPAQREKMPNHLLQWEAIRRAREAGCKSYDFWGAPEVFDETDAMWGVYRFKEGWGGQVLRTLGAYDLPTRPLLYRLYSQLIPAVLAKMRSRSRTGMEG